MAGWIDREVSWKKRETKEKSSFTTQGLFGMIKDLHRKISHSKTATVFSGTHTVKMFEDCQREFELQKSKAIAHISGLKTRLI